MKRRAQACQAEARFRPQSSLGQAGSYLLNEYPALVGYLRDGRLEIDNHPVENEVRPSAVGRKRWLCIGHPDAGWHLSACLHRQAAWSSIRSFGVVGVTASTRRNT